MSNSELEKTPLEKTPIDRVKKIVGNPWVQATAGLVAMTGAAADLVWGMTVADEEVRRGTSVMREELNSAKQEVRNFEEGVGEAVREGTTTIFISNFADPVQVQAAYSTIDRVQDRQLEIVALEKQLRAQWREENAIGINDFRLGRPLVDLMVAVGGFILTFIGLERVFSPNPKSPPPPPK